MTHHGYAPLVQTGSCFDSPTEDGNFHSDGSHGKGRSCCQCRSWPVIDPGASPYLMFWDGFVALLVVVVCFLAPFEVAFFAPKLDMLFIVNQFIDAAFVVDIMLHFFTGYHTPERPTTLIRDPSRIARNYVTGWFFIDVVTVLPIDPALIWLDREGVNFDVVLGARLVPAIRLFRLLRLGRLARLQRLLDRWHTSFGLTFAELSLCRFGGTVVACCHWMACLWGGMAVHLDTDHNWLTALQAAKGGPDELYRGAFEVYIKSLYWAVITLTSIGYGDITPQTASEYSVSVIGASLMASLWAYVIAAVCGIVSTMEPHETNYRRRMDDLNWMLFDHGVPHDMCVKVRRYLFETREISRNRAEQEVLDHLSPGLHGELAHFLHKKWVKKIWYLQPLPHEIVIRIAGKLLLAAYAPQESIRHVRTVCIVRRGLCARAGRILARGDYWGEDMLCSSEWLRDEKPVKSLSYLSVMMLHIRDLMEVTNNDHPARSKLRWAQVQMAFRSGMRRIRAAVEVLKSLDPERHACIMHGDRTEFVADVLNGTIDPSALQTKTRRESSVNDSPRRVASSCWGGAARRASGGFAEIAEIAELADRVDRIQTSLNILITHFGCELPTPPARPTQSRNSRRPSFIASHDADGVDIDFGGLVFGVDRQNSGESSVRS